MTTVQSRAAPWMGAGLLGSIALASAALVWLGAGQRGTVTALQLTARWAYCFFWPAYAGGALANLFGTRFEPLARRARVLGLAFAAAMLAHIAMIVRLYAISVREPIPLSSAIYFGIGLLFAYTLALFSVPALAARLPARARRWLFTLGLEYIALAFLRDFLHDPFARSLDHLLGYLPFVALALLALLLRVLVYGKRLHGAWARGRAGRMGAAPAAVPQSRR
ncbi:MAG: hypothetical protein ACYCT1_12960 [Steroidobacteraceae bacterium]